MCPLTGWPGQNRSRSTATQPGRSAASRVRIGILGHGRSGRLPSVSRARPSAAIRSTSPLISPNSCPAIDPACTRAAVLRPRVPGGESVADDVPVDLLHHVERNADQLAIVLEQDDRLIDGVGHVTLHLRRPDAVVQAIQDLLARIGG